MEERTIVKVLSANDTGDTGGHQAGILVPREGNILSFFPALDKAQYNPRAHVSFTDETDGKWEFAFIYYNNRFFGGTRNEYRLTRMTKYIRQSGLVPGDEILLTRSKNGDYSVSFRRKAGSGTQSGKGLTLAAGWREIDI